MVIRSAPRTTAAVIGALLAGLLLLLTGCATDGAGAGRTPGAEQSRASVGGSGAPGTADRPAWARGMPVVPAAELPAQARDTLRRIDAGGPFRYAKDGTVFGNHERLLPRHPRGYYHEYTVPTPGSGDRGARRIVTGEERETYYTDDHYRTFKAVLR